MAFADQSLPSVGTFMRFVTGAKNARDELRTFLHRLLENAQAGELATTAAQAAVVTAQAAADAAQADADAIGAPNTDGIVSVPLCAGVKDGGTWTLAITSGGLATLTRTAAAGATSYWLDVPLPARTSANKGRKPTGLRVNYTVNTARADNVRIELWRITEGADGAARTAAVLFGEDNADYDAAHDTPTKRGDHTGAPELHLAVITDAGTPAFLGAGQSLKVRIMVEGDPGGASVVTITNINLLYTEALVDLA